MPLDQLEESTERTGADMSFLDHLEALRWHLVRSAIAVLTLGIVCFIYVDLIFDGVILKPLDPNFITYRVFCKLSHLLLNDDSMCFSKVNMELISIQMAGQFTMHLSASIVAGMVAAFPYIAWEVWQFLKPALYEKERKNARGLVFYLSFLFLLGVCFGYFLITPLSVTFFGNYRISEAIDNQINLSSYIGMVTSTTLWCGIVFELPVIIYFLTKIGIVTPQWLRDQRRLMYVIILIIAAIITPPDVVSQIIVSLPLFVLYELGIFISARTEKQTL
jgi:sec-independent protein translocase protein TatC